MVKKIKDIRYYEAVGRRRESVARVRLYIVGKDKTALVNGVKMKAGEMVVNNRPIQLVFPSLREKVLYVSPLKITQSEDRFVVSAIVRGGGKNGQINALVHGLTRAIEKTDKNAMRPLLKKADLFTRDSRTRQRRHVGTGGKSRRVKQSPKR
jgi:small subunit ribosomal protein S9